MSCTRYVQPAHKLRIMAGTIAPWLSRHPRKSYIIQAILSCPPWVDRKALYVLRDEARRLTAVTGVEHTLDHIVPLNHPRVCGLTVPWNLVVMPRGPNLSKGNTWCPEQMELEL